MNDLYREILPEVKTAKQRESLFLILDRIANSPFTNEKIEIEPYFYELGKLGEAIVKYLRAVGIEAGVEQIYRDVEHMRAVVVRVAVTPTEDLAVKLHDWLAIDDGYIDLRKDDRMIGGVIVEVDGKHIDKSVRKWLAEKF